MTAISSIVFDLETTGLPRNRQDLLHPEQYEHFNGCRVVSISWLVEKAGSNVSQAYFIVHPDDFVVPESSTAIHGISQVQALQEGVPFATIAARFLEDLQGVERLVAHNIEFDFGVMKAELLRRGYPEIAKLMDSKVLVCTMKLGREVFGLSKSPRLAELYGMIKGTSADTMVSAHNAFYDTLHCFECYVDLHHRCLSKVPEALPLQLSLQQSHIVYEDIHRHMLVVACAGSGKTTTILCRIWWLLRQGVDPSSITLTTFTRLAAEDMRAKLGNILGFVPPIEIGTIDSLCLKYIKKYQRSPEEQGGHIHSVQEYGYTYHDMLTDPEMRAKMLMNKKYLFVDEFQDINDIQSNIIDQYAQHGVYVTAIGDDAQNIYSFRGSRIEYILNFTKRYKDAVVHTLTTNYRSNPPVVALANACIENNVHQIPKVMVSHHSLPGFKRTAGTLPPKLPIVKNFSSSFLQNEDVVEKIVLLREKGIPYHEMAVLCFQNGLLFPLEEMMTRVHIPNVFADKATHMGPATAQKRLNHVFLSTFHKAKGLEWRVVFLIHLNDEQFPSQKLSSSDIEEARRLFYVAVTRAKERLYLYYCPHYQNKFASRFINELPKQVYRSINHGAGNIGYSTTSIESPRMSVTKLVELLDGADFVHLKKTGILPATLAFEKTALYTQVGHSEHIERHDLFSDFGIFVDYFICRLLGIHFPTSNGLSPQTTLLALANVKLTKTENDVYAKYKHNFFYNTRRWNIHQDSVDACVTKLGINDATCLESHRLVPVVDGDREVLGDIIQKMIAMSKKYLLPVEQIAVMTERFLPNQFEKDMMKSLARFQDTQLHWREVLDDIWSVSKCDKVIKEKRRRLLFKHIPVEAVSTHYNDLYTDLEDVFVPFLKERFPNAKMIQCHEYLRMENGLLGEPDIRIDDTIIDIKCSKEVALKGEWIVQLLGYVILSRVHGLPVNTVAIFNPINGLWCEADVSEWRKDDALLDYLIKKKLEQRAE
jgi:DNA polymerase III epsilon subunit-like protein